MTAPRTRDQLGVCQHRATPCAGCANSHPAYHHLHRVHSTRNACQADQCSQGRAPCQTPSKCSTPRPASRIIFALLYLRNLHGFGYSHVHALAATRLDMALRNKRRRGTP